MNPPPINEPTLGEVLRRLDDVVKQLGDISREIKEDRAVAAGTYVRQDVYMAERAAQSAVVADLHGDIQAAKVELRADVKALKDQRQAEVNARRQVWLAIGGVAVTSLIAIAALIVNIVQG